MLMAGLGPGLVAFGSVWFATRRHPDVPRPIDLLRADPGLALVTILACIAPFAWPFLLALFVSIAVNSALLCLERLRDGSWSSRTEANSFTSFAVISTLIVVAMVPVSSPSAPLAWGVALPDDETPAWPSSTESSWVEVDGTILTATHVRMPGAVSPYGSAAWVAVMSEATGQDDERLRQASASLDDFISFDSVRIERIAVDSHEYAGEELRYERRVITFDLLGERTGAEVLTVYRPMWGGEVRVLTIIEPGENRFYADPWAENTVTAWMEAT